VVQSSKLDLDFTRCTAEQETWPTLHTIADKGIGFMALKHITINVYFNHTFCKVSEVSEDRECSIRREAFEGFAEDGIHFAGKGTVYTGFRVKKHDHEDIDCWNSLFRWIVITFEGKRSPSLPWRQETSRERLSWSAWFPKSKS
jgi:hypothetical protein